MCSSDLEKTTTAVHPHASYPAALFEIDPGTALVVECELPQARYWNVQLLDHWRGCVDYAERQSSLNMTQARLDADGVFRAVVSLTDPGVPNWLDPAGRHRGLIQFRFFFTDAEPLPDLRVVPLARLRDHLPGETPHVAPEVRRVALADRRRRALSRFGY